MELDSTPNRPAARIILADDAENERTVLAQLLRRFDYEVQECASGEAAVDQLKRGGSDLLLLDLQMPGMDGFDVLNYVHSHCPALPVILLSGMNVDQIQRKMRGLTKRELPPLILKPVNLDQLLQLLDLSLSGAVPEFNPGRGDPA